MAKPADSEYCHTLVRLRIGPAKPTINGIPGAKDRSGLLVGNLVGNQVSSIGVHRHVFSVTALYVAPRALQIGAEHPAAALAPFAASAGGLNPCRADAVADFASGHIRSYGNDLAHRFVAKDSRKLSGKVSKRLVHIGVADAACVHPHQHLTWSRLRLRNIFDLPGTARGGYDCGFHTLPPTAIRCERFCGRCMILDARIADRIQITRLTASWRMVSKPETKIHSYTHLRVNERNRLLMAGPARKLAESIATAEPLEIQKATIHRDTPTNHRGHSHGYLNCVESHHRPVYRRMPAM